MAMGNSEFEDKIRLDERERCAKIAVKYAEEEQRGITKLNRKASSGKKMIAAKNAALDIADAIRGTSASENKRCQRAKPKSCARKSTGQSKCLWEMLGCRTKRAPTTLPSICGSCAGI